MYAKYSNKIIIIIILLYQIFQPCKGGATVEVHFVSFKNDANKLQNSHKCDPLRGQCDTFFIICIDQLTRPYYFLNDMNHCNVFRGRTGVYANSRNVQFDHDMNGIHNPIIKHFTAWPGGLVVKAEAWDDDTGHSSHDLIEQGLHLVWRKEPSHTESEADFDLTVIRGPTGKSLTVELRVYCDVNWFGEKCDVFCEEQDEQSGHYRCDQDTGQKICHAGFEGRNCEIDKCQNKQCLNGGICDKGMCECRAGFSGDECSVDECAFITCFHGGACAAGLCNCAGTGYTGTSCDVIVDHCALLHLSSPCGGHGRCENDFNRRTFKCVCFEGYAGARCEAKVLAVSPSTTQVYVVTDGLTKQDLDDQKSENSELLKETKETDLRNGHNNSNEATTHAGESQFLWQVIVAVVLGVVILILVTVILVFTYRKKRKKERDEDHYDDIIPRSVHVDNPERSSSVVSHTTNPLYIDSRAPTPQFTRQDSMSSITPSVFLDIYAQPVLKSQRAPPSYTERQQSTSSVDEKQAKKGALHDTSDVNTQEKDNSVVKVAVF